MAKKTTSFKSKERTSRAEVSSFLRQLADKMAEGQLLLKQGEAEVALALPDSLILEIEVEEKVKKAKGKKHVLEIEIKWFEGERGSPLVIG